MACISTTKNQLKIIFPFVEAPSSALTRLAPTLQQILPATLMVIGADLAKTFRCRLPFYVVLTTCQELSISYPGRVSQRYQKHPSFVSYTYIDTAVIIHVE
jgi:hypothetical protein